MVEQLAFRLKSSQAAFASSFDTFDGLWSGVLDIVLTHIQESGAVLGDHTHFTQYGMAGHGACLHGVWGIATPQGRKNEDAVPRGGVNLLLTLELVAMGQEHSRPG